MSDEIERAAMELAGSCIDLQTRVIEERNAEIERLKSIIVQLTSGGVVDEHTKPNT